MKKFNPNQKTRETKKARYDEESLKETLEIIDSLVGCEPFKQFCHDLHERAPYIRSSRTEEIFRNQSAVFSIGDGEGATTAFALYDELLKKEGLIAPVGITEMALPGSEILEKLEMPDEIEVLNAIQETILQDTLVVFDLSSLVGHTSSPIFKRILMTIFKGEKKCPVLFRVGRLNERAAKEVLQDMNDVIDTEMVQFPEFTPPQIHELMQLCLADYGLTAQEDVWPLLDLKIAEEKSDGHFYGIHTVEKLAGRMIRDLHEYEAQHQTEEDITEIRAEHLASFREKKPVTQDSAQLLSEMIGMDGVKEKIHQIIEQMKAARTYGINTSMHMIFTGAPGTGKTMAAGIFARIMKEQGLLRTGRLYEYRGKDFCGNLVGESAEKTENICREAYGSVLFIDKANTLYRSEDNLRDYGLEAIDTLVSEMESHKEDFVVILAGSTEEMNDLVQTNSEVTSHIAYTINFPNFTRKELAQIFMRMLENGQFSYDRDVEKAVNDYFNEIPEDVLSDPNFGNAHFVKKLYEHTSGIAAAHMGGGDDSIHAADFTEATQTLYRSTPAKRRRIGFY